MTRRTRHTRHTRHTSRLIARTVMRYEQHLSRAEYLAHLRHCECSRSVQIAWLDDQRVRVTIRRGEGESSYERNYSAWSVERLARLVNHDDARLYEGAHFNRPAPRSFIAADLAAMTLQ